MALLMLMACEGQRRQSSETHKEDFPRRHTDTFFQPLKGRCKDTEEKAILST